MIAIMRRTINIFAFITIMVLAIASCKSEDPYNGHEYVDLGLSVKWATCNVGAQSPEDYGEFYAWGETRAKTIYTVKGYRFRAGGESYHDMKLSKYDPDEILDNLKKTVLDMADDVANVKWGGNWRMPTKEEIEELNWNCDWVWTTQNGVKGVKITSKVEGYTDRSIFIPAAGYRIDSRHLFAGVSGDYWSSTNSMLKTSACHLYFDSCGSSLDNIIVDYISELWYWHDDEGESFINELPQSLADKILNYFHSGNVNLDSIPESIFNEYRSYLSTQDLDLINSNLRPSGLPVRPVFP